MRPLIAALLFCLVCTTANARTRHDTIPTFDRHALYQVGSEAILTERVVRKVRHAGVKQIIRKYQKGKNQKRAIAASTIAKAKIGETAPLVEKARAYLGKTASQIGVRRSLWCSAFLRFITQASGVNDLAKSWLSKPRTEPSVGAIAVLTRGRRGGHVGVVSGFDKNGNPILISGNHGNRVAEAKYPKYRVIAYVSGG